MSAIYQDPVVTIGILRTQLDDARAALAHADAHGYARAMADVAAFAGGQARPVIALGEHASVEVVDLSGMSAAELGERVADCARTHGAQCAEIRRADTTPAWRRFREALALLVKRAGGQSA